MYETFEGIVLFRKKYREEDTIIKLLTKNHGKRMFFVRRGQLSNHSMRAQFLPYSTNLYVGTINPTGFSFIKEATTLLLPSQIHQDIILQAYASYFIQLMDAAFEDFHNQPAVYEFFKIAFEKLNSNFNPEIIRFYVEHFLLHYYGQQFNWQTCQICGNSQGPFDFSITQGGLLCEQHWHQDKFRLQILPKALYLAQRLIETPLQSLNNVKVNSHTTNELKRLMEEIYQEFVGIHLKSKQYLDEMSQTQQKYADLLANRQRKTDDQSNK